jgi:dipeptidyl aminopeptidase/acylaminoacyl peptidase
MQSRTTAVLASTLLAVLVFAASAHAAFPGANGKINFVRSPGGAYFMNPDGSAQTPAPVAGIWSPDAGHVLRSCDNAVCVQRADGTFEQENYYAAAVHGMGWSPDGTNFVHAEQQCGASFCDPDKVIYQGFLSGPSVEVTAQDDLEPAWSPDGTRIAFVTFRHDPRQLVFDGPPGPEGSTELYVSNIDGMGQLRLTNSPGSEGGPTQTGVDDNDGESLPSWSPDGTKIAFASNRDGNWEIYVVNADGSGSQRLTNNPATDLRPRWSPDGTKIAFQSDRDGNQEIYSMNPDGSGQTNLTHNPADDILYDWLTAPVTGPQRADYKNAAQFCKAERDFLGDAASVEKYGTNGNGADAYGKCVSQNH